MQPRFIGAAPGGAPPAQSGVTAFTSAAGSCTCGNLPSISFQGQATWTFEAWVYLDALLDQMPLLSREGEFLLGTQGGQVSVSIDGMVPSLLSPPVLQPQTWTNLAVAFDGTTLYLYVNGSQVTTLTPTGGGVANQDNPFTIGGGFYGQLASVRLWSTYVAPGQLYQNQWTVYPSGTAGLVAQFDFTQDPPVDTSGNAVPLTASAGGVGPLAYTPAVVMTTDGFADTYDDGSINPGGQAADFSVMAWVCPTTIGGTGPYTLFSNGPSGGDAGVFLSVLASGNVQFQVGSSTALTSNAVLDEGTWVNVAATWQSASGTGTLYVNGVQDSSATGMTLAGSLATGAPLVGAVAWPPDGLPLYGFEGYVQSVSVWNVALTAGEVQANQATDPAVASGCVAAYDFGMVPALNQVTFNPIGLAGGATLGVVESGGAGGGVFPPAWAASRAGRDDWGVPAGPGDEALLSDETRARMVEDFRGFVGRLGIGGERAAALQARFAGNLGRARDELRAGTYRMPLRVTPRHENGQGYVLLESGAERVELALGALDPCTTWVISFLIAIVGALFSALGFVANLGSMSSGFTTLLGTRINSIGLLPQLAAVFNGGVTASAVWQAISLLYEFKLLTPMVKLAWQGVQGSVSYWTMASVGARLLLLLSPVAALEVALFVAELAYSIVGVVSTWNQKPAGCLSSN